MQHLVEQARYYDALIRQNPNEPGPYVQLGIILLNLNSLDNAQLVYKDALRRFPDNAKVNAAYGVLLQKLRQPHQARQYLNKALELDERNAVALFSLAQLDLDFGDFDAAEIKLYVLRKLNPDIVEVAAKLAMCKKALDDSDPRLKDIGDLLQRNNLDDNRRAELLFARGKLLDDLEHYQRAFIDFEQANQIRAKHASFNRQELIDRIDMLIKTFDQSFVDKADKADTFGQRVIFFVGPPRSGSSLLDQILSCHSQTVSYGENLRLAKFNSQLRDRLMQDPDYPFSLRSLTTQALAQETDRLQKVYFEDTKSPFILDKSLNNFYHIGLLHLLMPSSKIVEMVREPKDICLSLFINDFSQGHQYSHSLDDIVFFYQQYRRLMDHWHQLEPVEIIPFQYEALVDSPAEALRSLLSKLGVGWESGLLSFYKKDGYLGTASNWQARQPLFKSSIRRWRNYADEVKRSFANL